MMKKLLSGLFLMLTAFGFLLAAATNASADEVWLKVQSKNFLVLGNADEADLRKVASRLEQFREVFTRLFPQFKFNSPIPTRVVVFRERKTFDRFKPIDWAAGFFLPGDDVNHIVLSTEGGEANNLSTVFHEYTHFLVDNTLGRAKIPPWLNEGIAEYQENLTLDNQGRATIGGAPEANLKILQRSRLIPLENLFSTDYYTLHKQTRETAALFYAQSWLVVHYLIHGGNAPRRAQFDRFVGLLAEGSKPKDALRSAFQIDAAELEPLLAEYAGRKKFSAEILPSVKLQLDDQLTTTMVAAADAKTFQADILYHANRLAEAEVYLREALAIDPESGFANAVFGLVRMRQKRFFDARELFEKAVQAKDANYLTFFNHAYAISREAVTEYGFAITFSPDDAEKMRLNLRRAIELNPSYAESYSLLAFIDIVRNERLDEGIADINKALAIAPGNQWYLMRLAELLMRKEDFNAARQIVIGIRQTSSTDQLKIYAENTIRTINSLEWQLRAIADEDKKERRDEVTDEPLSDEEIRRRREIAMLESLNVTLRRTRGDEKRILGKLEIVDCRIEEMFFVVQSESGRQRLRAETLETVRLISYDPRFVNAEFGCGPVPKENLAVFTFRPAALKGNPGELIAIEFVPKNFKFVEGQK